MAREDGERNRERATVIEERDGRREGRKTEYEREGESDGETKLKKEKGQKERAEREGKRKDRERKVRSLGSLDNITSALRQLQWLRVKFRVTNKLCLLMHSVYVGRYQGYIADSMTQT